MHAIRECKYGIEAFYRNYKETTCALKCINEMDVRLFAWFFMQHDSVIWCEENENNTHTY